MGGSGRRADRSRWGAVAGSVLTVLASVVTAYVPSFRDEARRRSAEKCVQAEREAAAAGTAWEAVGEPAVGGAPAGPSGWLRADRAVVEFTGREGELGGLRERCQSVDAGPVRVLVGEGGTARPGWR